MLTWYHILGSICNIVEDATKTVKDGISNYFYTKESEEPIAAVWVNEN